MTEAAAGWDAHLHVFDARWPLRGGHYRPPHRPLAMAEAEAARLGVGHLVLVQPSVYGHDNALLLQALATSDDRHRGVVVLAGTESDDALDTMHALGVRGARLNLVSPVGEGEQPAQRFHDLAPRLRERGWHLQWYAAPGHLAAIAALHAQAAPVCVLDHLGGMHAELADGDGAWDALAALADHGAWIKLSGWYRLRAAAPYAELQRPLRRVLSMFEGRCVWGSDWPHTGFAPGQEPPYASAWAPVLAALGERKANAMLREPPAIYR